MAAFAAAGTLAALGATAWAVRGRSASVFAPSVHRGVTTRRAIALTFDDGPSESTPRLLEILARNAIPATFFFCGANVRRCPEIAREVADAGHEIANHTDSHPHFWRLGPAEITREIDTAQRTITDATGKVPNLFRAPYGERWFGLRDAQKRHQLLGVMWTVIGRDWKWPGGAVAERLLANANNGGIFCLHDGREVQSGPNIQPTLEAVEQVIPQLRDRGFHFETVSQILCPTN
jgi:peptidoglycan/xylan/chitin deacetylase (PgdA/CDA1 family)